MGYNIQSITIHLRLDNHLGPETERDIRAAADLRREIDELIDSSPEYEAIVMSMRGP